MHTGDWYHHSYIRMLCHDTWNNSDNIANNEH